MTRSSLARCARLLVPHRRLLAFILLVNVASGLSGGVADPVVQKFVFDSLAAREIGRFATAAVLMVVLGTLLRVFGYVSAIYTQRLKNALARDLTLHTFGTFYRLPYAEVAAHDRGYFISRVFDEPARGMGQLVDTGLRASTAIVTFVGAVSVTLWLSWKVAVVLTAVVPVLLYLSRRFSARISDETRKSDEGEAVLKDGLGRAVDAYRTVSIFGLYDTVRTRVSELLDGYLGTLQRRMGYAARFESTSRVFLSYAELAVLVGAGIQVLNGQLSIGGLFAFMGAYWRVVNSANALISLVPAWATLSGQMGRMEEFGARARPHIGGVAAEDGSERGLELRGAAYSYGSSRVLEEVTLSVPAGRRVLVRGPNGSGKSTLAHLAAGLLEADGGEQRVPPLSRVSAALLPPGFIPGSLLENAGFGEMDAARRAAFVDLAGRFGLAGKLDRDPATFSQGEQRKAQVAVALAKDADLYILDEPLANVDADSKDGVMEAIFAATRGRRLLVIMHGDDRFRAWFDEELELGASAAPVPELAVA